MVACGVQTFKEPVTGQVETLAYREGRGVVVNSQYREGPKSGDARGCRYDVRPRLAIERVLFSYVGLTIATKDGDGQGKAVPEARFFIQCSSGKACLGLPLLTGIGYCCVLGKWSTAWS